MSFHYANTIVGLLHAIDDLSQHYANDFEYADSIESHFIDYVENVEGDYNIGIIEDINVYLRFQISVNSMIEEIKNDIDGDDDIDDIISAINTIVNITDGYIW